MLSTSSLVVILTALSAVTGQVPSPTVQFGEATLVGTTDGTTSSFLGIPFAEPPVGPLRLRPPRPLGQFTGVHNAINFGAACPQLGSLSPDLPGPVTGNAVPTNQSEDCLFLNVVKPANVTANQMLPVVFWIYGGGFSFGASSVYDGRTVVNRSLSLGEPVIYVSTNYRMNVFGFLGGKEIAADGAGNLGLQDQRLALRWVQQNIRAFGGDPTRVTIWGESAGAISVVSHMVTNGGNTEGLFRAGVMESGSAVPTLPILLAQPTYDVLVNVTGCSTSHDTLACLRTVPFATIRAALDTNPAFGAASWLPVVDGVFFEQSPQQSVEKGQYARIPIISGDCDDEGTLFSLNDTSVTTDAEFLTLLQTEVFPGITSAQANEIAALYPSDPAAGSPFDTGDANAITPQFKRVAAVRGDAAFQAPRRFFLNATSKTQDTFSYLTKRNKAVPTLGSFHASDIATFYATPGVGGDGAGADALINFATTLNPNVKHDNSALSNVDWPKYSTVGGGGSPKLLLLTDSDGISITDDTFRQQAIDLVGRTERALVS